MERAADLVSPRQVARAIGVSVSSLKRWCDQGLIQTVRTAGGHRKLPTADVLRFIREQGHVLVSPTVLGLPIVSEQATLGLHRARPRLVEALLAPDEPLARQIIIDLYLAKHSISMIADAVIAPAFHEIGVRWADRHAEIFAERRSCELMMRLLCELRKLQSAPDVRWSALGGTIAGDWYRIPTTLAELVLRDAGFNATSLGTSIPIASLINAVQAERPTLFWLSVSHIPDKIDFVVEFDRLSQACQEVGSALVVGGQELTPALRAQMSYSAYCDTMQHLQSFAQTLRRPPRRARSKPDNGGRSRG